MALNLDNVFSSSYSEAEKEQIIFKRLSEKSIDPDPQYSFRVKAYKEKREQKITEAVRMLNALCDFRDSDETHKQVKRAFKNMLVPYTYLTDTDKRSPVRDVELQHKLQDQKRKPQPSLTPIKIAMNSLLQKDGVERLCRCIKFDLLASSLRFQNLGYFSVDPFNLGSWDNRLTAKCRQIRTALEPHYDKSSLTIFDEQALIATTQTVCSLELHTKPSGNNLLLNQDALADGLLVSSNTAWQDARSRYHATDAYKQYHEMRKTVRAALREIKPYCTLDELTKHPKLQNNARAKLPKYFA